MVLAEVSISHELLCPLYEVRPPVHRRPRCKVVDRHDIVLQLVSGAIVVVSGRPVLVHIHRVEANLSLAKGALDSEPVVLEHAVGEGPDAGSGVHEAFLFGLFVVLELLFELVEFELGILDEGNSPLVVLSDRSPIIDDPWLDCGPLVRLYNSSQERLAIDR